MGICSSCLGSGRGDNTDPESSRLLDDEIYQPGYGYGALNTNNQANQPDPGYVRREREALEAICQRTSDSVIDIWSLQPQPHLQPQATLHSQHSASSTSSKAHEPSVIVTTAEPDAPGDSTAKRGAIPKHWGEVVINPRKGRSRPGSGADDGDGAKDVFGVLKVS
ncbi:late endosomal/lysosomal adaptor and MAPK and MTOR activator-domain-containing protein [Aspergillus unguis]